jgi:oligopeptide transport system substrate-binding protein
MKLTSRVVMTALSVLLSFSSLLGTGAAAEEAAAPPPARTSLLRVHLAGEPVTLDWTVSQHRLNDMILRNLQEGMATVTADFKLVPVLAERWEELEGGKLFRFHLRKGVLWSDGVPLVARHFVDAWKRLLSPINVTGQSFILFDVVNAQEFHEAKLKDFDQVGIKSVGDSTVEVRLKTPVPEWEWYVAMSPTFPIRQDLIDKHSANWTKPGLLVTEGPYVLKEHTEDVSYELVRNPRYWGKSPAFERVEFRILTDELALSQFLESKVDIVCLLGGAARNRARSWPEILWSPAISMERIEFNMTDVLTGSRDFRRAVAQALDRKQLASQIAGLITAGSLVPPSVRSFNASAGVPFDPAGARKLLAKFRNMGRKFKLELLVPIFDENGEERLKSAINIRDQLARNLGIEVEINAPNAYKSYAMSRDMRSYNMIIRNWVASSPDPRYFYRRYASEAAKDLKYSNAAYDAILKQVDGERNPARQQALYHQANAILTEGDVMTIPLFYRSEAGLLSSSLRGYRPNSYSPCDLKDVRPK